MKNNEKSLKCDTLTYLKINEVQLYYSKKSKFHISKKAVMKNAIEFYFNAIAKSIKKKKSHD